MPKRPHLDLIIFDVKRVIWSCLDIAYVLCYLARVMSDVKSHTTRSWSIRVSDSSATCTQFWVTAPISLPATFDLRYPAHNYRRLHDDCRVVCECYPCSTLTPCCLSASSHLLLIKTYATPWLLCRWAEPKMLPIMASGEFQTFDTRHFVNFAHSQTTPIPLSVTRVFLIATKGAMILVRA